MQGVPEADLVQGKGRVEVLEAPQGGAAAGGYKAHEGLPLLVSQARHHLAGTTPHHHIANAVQRTHQNLNRKKKYIGSTS